MGRANPLVRLAPVGSGAVLHLFPAVPVQAMVADAMDMLVGVSVSVAPVTGEGPLLVTLIV